MSRTSYTVCIPLREGETTTSIPSSAYSGSDAKIDGAYITFVVGPNWLDSVLVERRVIVSPVHKRAPRGFKTIGRVECNGEPMRVLVDFPSSP